MRNVFGVIYFFIGEDAAESSKCAPDLLNDSLSRGENFVVRNA